MNISQELVDHHFKHKLDCYWPQLENFGNPNIKVEDCNRGFVYTIKTLDEERIDIVVARTISSNAITVEYLFYDNKYCINPQTFVLFYAIVYGGNIINYLRSGKCQKECLEIQNKIKEIITNNLKNPLQ